MPVYNNPQLIPKTRRRTALSMGLFYSKLSYSEFADVIAAGSASLATNTSVIRIGSFETLREVETRGANAQYELDYEYPGEIADVIPTRPERTITIDKVVLYSSGGTGDILEALGLSNLTSGNWTIMDQLEPLTIIRFEAVPAKADGTKMTVNSAAAKEIITFWENCWLTANPKDYEIMGDLKIMQSCTLTAGRKYVTVQ